MRWNRLPPKEAGDSEGTSEWEGQADEAGHEPIPNIENHRDILSMARHPVWSLLCGEAGHLHLSHTFH